MSTVQPDDHASEEANEWNSPIFSAKRSPPREFLSLRGLLIVLVASLLGGLLAAVVGVVLGFLGAAIFPRPAHPVSGMGVMVPALSGMMLGALSALAGFCAGGWLGGRWWRKRCSNPCRT